MLAFAGNALLYRLALETTQIDTPPLSTCACGRVQ